MHHRCKTISYRHFKSETHQIFVPSQVLTCSAAAHLFVQLVGFFLSRACQAKHHVYSVISFQIPLVFQPPALLWKYNFICKKYSFWKQLLSVLLLSSWRRITVYQGDGCSAKLKLFDPIRRNDHQRTEVLIRLQNVASSPWTFDPAFIENTVQGVTFLLLYRPLYSIQSVFHTANLQGNLTWNKHSNFVPKPWSMFSSEFKKKNKKNKTKLRVPRNICLIIKYFLYTPTTIYLQR